MPPVLRGIVHGIFCEILNIARIVVDPRQGHGLRPRRIARPPRLGRVELARRPLAEVEFIYKDVVEGLRKVPLAASFKELAFDFGGVDFIDGDGAELEKLAVANLALEDNLTRHDIGTVDVAEHGDILRAVFQRKGDAQRIAVGAAEHTVFGHILKRSAGFENGIASVDSYFHSYLLCKGYRVMR